MVSGVLRIVGKYTTLTFTNSMLVNVNVGGKRVCLYRGTQRGENVMAINRSCRVNHAF